MYFKGPSEGMDEIGKLETGDDLMVMTSLVSRKLQYIEVFAVLVEKPPPPHVNNDGNEGNGENYASEEDDEHEWHPDSSNDGNSEQANQEVSSVNRGVIEYMRDKWDDNRIEFIDETIGGSDDEKMALSSDDEVDAVFPEFNEEVDMMNPKFELGLCFGSAEILRRVVRSHAIVERRHVVRTPNMGHKVQYQCTPHVLGKSMQTRCKIVTLIKSELTMGSIHVS